MKRILAVVLFSSLFYGCDVIKQLPTMTGGVTESEAGEGIKEALSQGLVGAVLKLNKEDGFLKMLFIRYWYLTMPGRLKILYVILAWAVWLIKQYYRLTVALKMQQVMQNPFL